MAWPRTPAPSTLVGQPLPRRNPDLPRHEVEAGHELGDAVLDLEARVHLEEVVAPIGVEQELDRRGVVELDRCRPRAGRSRRARLAVASSTAGEGDSSTSFWWRRWTQQSRSPSTARPPCRSPSSWTSTCRAGAIDPLDVDRPVAECRQGLAARGGQRIRHAVGRLDASHAPSPTSRRRLEHEREPDGRQVGRVALDGQLRAGDDRHAGGRGAAPGGQLVAERLERLGRWADEDEPGVGDRPRERRVLGEEAVPRMDRLRAAPHRGVEDRLDRQVRLRRRRAGRSARSDRRGGRGAHRRPHRSGPRPARCRALDMRG